MPFRTIASSLHPDNIACVGPPGPTFLQDSEFLSIAVLNDFTRQRAEERIPQRMFVRLYLPDGGDFEMAQTIDISRHGARISTRKCLQLNQHLTLRSLRGNFTSYARVAHCHALPGNCYSLGLELYNPVGDWTPSRPTQRKTA